MVNHQAEKAAILDKCCQSVECLARGKVFDLVGTLDLPQSSSSVSETVSWEARPPHSDWRLIAPEHVDDYRAKDWEVRPHDHTQTPAEPDTRALLQFVGWVDSWVSNPVGAYSVHALDGLFRMTREKIAALSDTSTDRPTIPNILIDRHGNDIYTPDELGLSSPDRLEPAGKQARGKNGNGAWFGVIDSHNDPAHYDYRTVYAVSSPDRESK